MNNSLSPNAGLPSIPNAGLPSIPNAGGGARSARDASPPRRPLKLGYSVKVRKTNGGRGYCARVEIDLGRNKVLVAEAHIDVRALHTIMARAATGRMEISGTPMEIGFSFFKKIWRGVKKIAKKVVKSKALGFIAKIIKNPVVTGVLSAIPGVGTVAAGALMAAGTAWDALRAKALAAKGLFKDAKKLLAKSKKKALAKGLSVAQWKAAAAHGAAQSVSRKNLEKAKALVRRGKAAVELKKKQAALKKRRAAELKKKKAAAKVKRGWAALARLANKVKGRKLSLKHKPKRHKRHKRHKSHSPAGRVLHAYTPKSTGKVRLAFVEA